ncbi:MAG: type II secretion system protein GspL [Pseudomonadales bacterium]|nr:type II secretion system protein GspL [Pseudomonadales bacterium]
MLTPAIPITDEEGEGYETFSIDCEWLIVEDDGGERANGRTDYRGLRDLADPTVDWITDPGNIIVLVPNEFVFTTVAQVPGASAGQMRRALPFVIEEFIADDIEEVHIALPPGMPQRGMSVPCSVIATDLIENWVNCFTSMGFAPGYLLPETELLPSAPGEISLLIDGDQVLVRTEDQAAMLDRENLNIVLEAETLERIQVIGGELSGPERDQVGGRDIEIDMDATQGSILVLLAARWPVAEATNLLQGPYAVRRKSDPDAARWKSVAALAAVWLVIFAVALVAQGLWSSTQANRLEAESLALYRDLFPNDQTATPRTVRRRLAARLGEAVQDPGGRGFIEYVADLAAVSDNSVTVLGLNYAEGRSELSADLRLARYEDLDQLKESLAARGVNAEISSAEEVEGGVRARMRLSTS